MAGGPPPFRPRDGVHGNHRIGKKARAISIAIASKNGGRGCVLLAGACTNIRPARGLGMRWLGSPPPKCFCVRRGPGRFSGRRNPARDVREDLPMARLDLADSPRNSYYQRKWPPTLNRSRSSKSRMNHPGGRRAYALIGGRQGWRAQRPRLLNLILGAFYVTPFFVPRGKILFRPASSITHCHTQKRTIAAGYSSFLRLSTAPWYGRSKFRLSAHESRGYPKSSAGDDRNGGGSAGRCAGCSTSALSFSAQGPTAAAGGTPSRKKSRWAAALGDPMVAAPRYCSMER